MKQAGIREKSAYFRKMAIDGYILTMEIPELKEMISLMRYSSNNLNQIAKRVNGTGEIIETELKEVRDSQEKIWNGINRILKRLGEMP
jgi:FtsZ-binding cell division protein ZapB